MFILPIKSRLQILKERENPESVWTGRTVIMFVCPTPEKNAVKSSRYRAENFVRFVVVVSKKYIKKLLLEISSVEELKKHLDK